MMKKFTVFIIDMLFCIGVAFAQYPIYEDFDSINVSGRWSNVTGQTTLCSHFGSICYNCYSSSYNTNDVYLYQSPNYITQFNDTECDSIEVEFNFSYNLRPNDSLYLIYNNYSTNTVKYLQVLDTNFNLSTFTSYAQVYH